MPATTDELLGGTLELLLCVKLDEDTAEELEATKELLEATDELLGGTLELLLCVKLDEDTAEELETTELLEATDELLDDETSNELLDKEPPNELELNNSTSDELLGDKNPSELELTPIGEELELHPTGGGGISRSDEQEISSEVQSTAARVIEQGKSFFIVCSPFKEPVLKSV